MDSWFGTLNPSKLTHTIVMDPNNDTLSAVVTQLGLDDFDGTDDETPIQLHIPEIPVLPVQPAAPVEVGIPYYLT